MANEIPIFDFPIETGDSALLKIVVKDNQGAPKNISGATLNMTIRKTGLPQIKFVKTLADDLTITDGPAGEVDAVINVGEITVPGAYDWALEVVVSGESQTTVKGKIFARSSLTPNT